MENLIRVALAVLVVASPAYAHHSFAMYDQTVTKTLSGKLTRYVPGANHAQLLFIVVDNDGKPVMKDSKPMQFGVETGSAIAMARNNVTVKTMSEGTFITVRYTSLVVIESYTETPAARRWTFWCLRSWMPRSGSIRRQASIDTMNPGTAKK